MIKNRSRTQVVITCKYTVSQKNAQISPDNLRMMNNSCYSLLLILKQSNSESNSESELLSSDAEKINISRQRVLQKRSMLSLLCISIAAIIIYVILTLKCFVSINL